jgi:Leishmanolysin
VLTLSRYRRKLILYHQFFYDKGIGTLWVDKGVTGPVSSNCPYRGPRANAEYQAISGCSVVPTENDGSPGDGTFCGHWDEACMGSELMTGFLNGGLNPLSRISIASLQDLGYTVNYSPAESYVRNNLNANCTCTRRTMMEVTDHRETSQLGLSVPSTRRRRLSDEAYQTAVSYGQGVLNERVSQNVFVRSADQDIDHDAVYVGNKAVVVFVEDGGAYFDVVVRAGV